MRSINLIALALVAALSSTRPALAATTFEIWSVTITKPGTIDIASGELLDTKIRGSAHLRAKTVDAGDIGRVMTISGNLGDYSLDSCSDFGSSIGTCSSSVQIAGAGHVVACGIPPTGTMVGDCDEYYKTEATGTFFFVTFSTFSNCAGLDCDCT